MTTNNRADYVRAVMEGTGIKGWRLDADREMVQYPELAVEMTFDAVIEWGGEKVLESYHEYRKKL